MKLHSIRSPVVGNQRQRHGWELKEIMELSKIAWRRGQGDHLHLEIWTQQKELKEIEMRNEVTEDQASSPAIKRSYIQANCEKTDTRMVPPFSGSEMSFVKATKINIMSLDINVPGQTSIIYKNTMKPMNGISP